MKSSYGRVEGNDQILMIAYGPFHERFCIVIQILDFSHETNTNKFIASKFPYDTLATLQSTPL